MKKLRIVLVFALVFLLLLLVNAAAVAQEEFPTGVDAPETITNVVVQPSPVYIGQSVSITTTFDFNDTGGNPVPIGNHVAICIYFRPTDDAAIWAAAVNAFPASVTTARATYNRVTGNCHASTIYADAFYYVVTDTSGFDNSGDILAFRNMIMPSVPAGIDKYVAFYLYTGSDCDNSNGNNTDRPWLGSSTCSNRINGFSRPFAVSDPSTIRYVSDTAGCGTNSPCHTGLTGLQDAITAINALPGGMGTVRIVGTATSTGADITSKDILVEPWGGSSTLSCSGTGGYLLRVTGTGRLSVRNGLTVNGQGTCGTGLAINATSYPSLLVANSTIQNFVLAGVAITNTRAELDYTTLSGNGVGVMAQGGAAIIRGGTFTGNTSYAIWQNTATLTAFANNISGNNGGGYQAYLTTPDSANVAKNWWGSASTSGVGPRDASGSHSLSWSRRLGADVVSSVWGLSGGQVSLGNANLVPDGSGGSGTPVIISLGRDSANAPFGNGVAPYVNDICSDFYDFYVAYGGGTWIVGLPVDTSPATCTSFTLRNEVAYRINPAKYDSSCAVAADQGCWDLIDRSLVISDSVNNRLLITQSALDLAYEHITTGDPAGNDPTAIELSSLTVSPARAWLPWGLLGLSLVLGCVGLYLARRKM
jgi:hypothetical protein